MIRLCTHIIHDTRRAGRIDPLLERLPPTESEHGVSWSPQAVTGGSGLSPWVGMVCAITSAPIWFHRADQATHLLLIEDDAEPCPDFMRHALAAVAARPHDAISFFATRDQAGDEMDAAALAGLSWAPVTRGPVGALAVVLPAPMARRLVRFFNAYEDAEFRRLNRGPAGNAGDARLWWFLVRVCGQALMVSSRSLVGHGGDGIGESLVHEAMQAPRPAYRPVLGVAGLSPGGDAPPPAGIIDWTLGSDIDARLACWEAV